MSINLMLLINFYPDVATLVQSMSEVLSTLFRFDNI